MKFRCAVQDGKIPVQFVLIFNQVIRVQFFNDKVDQPPDQQTDSIVVLRKTSSKHYGWKRERDIQKIKQLVVLKLLIF